MIFKEEFESLYVLYYGELNLLFNKALNNQSHSGNLLIVLMHGSSIPNYVMVGEHEEGIAFLTQLRFLETLFYQGHSQTSLIEHELNLKQPIKPEFQNLKHQEELICQIEMLAYLKIWEADYFIRKWHQLTLVIKGKEYDWHLPSIKKFNCPTYISKIKYAIKPFSTIIGDAMDKVTWPQLRNAIAHSNYSIIGRTITLFNHDRTNQNYSRPSLSMSEWIEINHISYALLLAFMKFEDLIQNHYEKIAHRENGVEIKTVINGKLILNRVQYNVEDKRWRFLM